MSTLPHDASSRIDTAPLVTAQQTEQDLDAVVREFDAVAEEAGMARPPAAELRELCRQVADISRDVIGRDVRIRVGRDWEVADDIYFVADVWTSGTPDDVVARANEWHLAVHELAGEQWRLFCLSFHVV
ncbi:MAG TPA: hypothetical protein VFI31_04335 [Pirellulales bacterium]|nr:hypothetical protein [Pirellulales bacterium]